jgi:hypothetical protein
MCSGAVSNLPLENILRNNQAVGNLALFVSLMCRGEVSNLALQNVSRYIGAVGILALQNKLT